MVASQSSKLSLKIDVTPLSGTHQPTVSAMINATETIVDGFVSDKIDITGNADDLVPLFTQLIKDLAIAGIAPQALSDTSLPLLSCVLNVIQNLKTNFQVVQSKGFDHNDGSTGDFEVAVENLSVSLYLYIVLNTVYSI